MERMRKMVQNNLSINQRDVNASPVCWYDSRLNTCAEINALTATQQDLFYYMMYLGRKAFDNAWKKMSDLKDKDSDDDEIYADDVWIQHAYDRGLFAFDVLIADIARAINSTNKTSRLIDDIHVVASTIISISKCENPFVDVTIDGTERKKNLHVEMANVEIFRRKSLDNKGVCTRSFVGFRLWYMVQLNRYAKILFRLVVQWQTRGETPEYTDIARLFGIPDSASTSAYMTRYIQPACDEIRHMLQIEVTAIPRYDTKDGRRLAGVKFQFNRCAYATCEVSGGTGLSRLDIDGYEYLIPPIPKQINDLAVLVMRGKVQIKIRQHTMKEREQEDRGIIGCDVYWIRDWNDKVLPEPILVPMYGAKLGTKDIIEMLTKIAECE